MKNIRFFIISASCCLLAGFTSCDKGDNQVSVNEETATDNNMTNARNTGEDGLTFRVPCNDFESCEVLLKVVSGTVNITVCGILDGTFSCSGSTACGILYPLAETYTSSPFSFCVPHGGTFQVRNNDSGSITIELEVNSVNTPNQLISGNSSADFEIIPECEQVDPC